MSHKISNLASEYLEYLDEQVKRRKKSRNTRDLTERAFRKLINCLGDLDLRFMSAEHAERFQNQSLDLLGKTTVNIYMRTLRPAFRWAMNRRHWIKADIFKIPALRVSSTKMRIYKPYEFNAMLLAVPKLNSEMWRARLLCGRYLGMRRNEVLHLSVSDIDYERNEIHIQPKKETHNTLAWEPKDKERRVVPMIDMVSEALSSVLATLPAGQAYLLISPQRNFRVFEMRRAGKLSDRVRLELDLNFNKPFNRILERAKVAHGTFHDLRKTFATTLAENRAPLHYVQATLGHSDVETTKNYYISVNRDKMLNDIRFILNLDSDELNNCMIPQS